MRDAGGDVVAMLGPDKTIEPIARTEVRSSARFVLVDTQCKMRGNAAVHSAAIAVSQEVDPSALLFAIHDRKEERSGTPGQARGDDESGFD